MLNEIEQEHSIVSLKGLRVNEIAMGTKKLVDEMISIGTREELAAVIQLYFPGHTERPIRDFFGNHPVRWFDLIRKLSKYRKNNSDKGWYVEDDAIEDIYTTFLVRGRTDNIGEKLRNLLPTTVSRNQKLLGYASTQPSILEFGSDLVSDIPVSKRRHFIKKLVFNGLFQNIDGSNSNNIEEYFEKVFPELLRYLDSIFGIIIPIGHCKTTDQLIKQLEKMFNSGDNQEKENAFRVIQSIHAWSGISYIQELHDTAQGEVYRFPKIIEQTLGVKMSKIESSIRDGAIIYSSTFIYNAREYDISWRVKSVQSILQKQWESEEYTNADAMRDVAASSLIHPDGDENGDTVELMSKICGLMPNFGYLLKDKNGIGSKIKEVERRAREKGKNPAYISFKRGGSTNGNFKSSSVSGFMRFGKSVSLGTEFQILSKSSFEWKKVDDKKYKPRSAIEALVRGSKYCTPEECINLLNKRIEPSEFPNLGVTSLEEIVYEMIADSFVIPYVSEDGTWYFTTKDKEKKFCEKFPSMIKTDMKYIYPKI